MPTVEKIRGGEVYFPALEQDFSKGDRADVSDGLATYLCDERGDFEVVEDDGTLDTNETSGTKSDDGEDICGVEKSDGETCTRPADECPYHDSEEN
ncbi:hypothetical protein SAMN05421858_5115 [Haladaptatus litoreus]|uniref:Uncharacterized protein n=1 Tax=Haladaptatus litoreus TaxID=553468 RepID=A0A1N7FJ41_9EURY|nr:hypothetical protein [Haladaptatus litoreus]SIS00310.1 hypothetical protein SAMN05421858_5115 [Haladaptatus litoreus]